MGFELIGIGNAIVDLISEKEDSFLKENNMEKGSMMLIDEERALELSEIITPEIIMSGGSVANTIHGFSSFGGKGAFIGKVKNDEYGKKYINEMENVGVSFLNKPKAEGLPTARSFILVTPDSQRTMNTYLGMAGQLDENDIDLDAIKETRIVLVEGYLYDLPETKETINHICRIAKDNYVTIAFSLCDSFCVNRHREDFKSLIEQYVDIVICNEFELQSLYETNNLDLAIHKISEVSNIAAVTRHEKGSVIVTKDEIYQIPPVHVDNVIDSTGAGDLYASGFLFGYINNMPLGKCGQLASLAASEAISHLGPRPKIILADLLKKVA